LQDEQTREKDKNFLVSLTLKDEEIEEQKKQIETLKFHVPLFSHPSTFLFSSFFFFCFAHSKIIPFSFFSFSLSSQLSELERQWNNNKLEMNKYLNDVEDWKKKTTERFMAQLNAKDAEIAELRDTANALMKSDPAEMSSVMNQLLDFIGTDTKGQASPTAAVSSPEKRNKVPQEKDNVPTPSSPTSLSPKDSTSSTPPPSTPATTTTTTTTTIPPAASAPTPAQTTTKESSSDEDKKKVQRLEFSPPPPKKVFKVLVPGGAVVQLECKDGTKLQEIMEAVCAKKNLLDVESYALQHYNAVPTAPYLNLNDRVGLLGITSARLVRKEVYKPMMMNKEPSDKGIGLPFNVFHSDHKSVDDLLKLMEDNLSDRVSFLSCELVVE
jgi:hypothetical protein